MSFISVPRREDGAKANLIQAVAIGVIITAFSYLVGAYMGWVPVVNWLEVAAVFLSYGATFLCVVERRANYPIGAVANGLYSVLFFQYGLLASSIVTGYLTFALIYGWIRWKGDENTKPVGRVELKYVPLYLLATAAFYLGALAVVTWAGGTLAMTDTAILIGTILAQFLLDNKRIENWFVWMGVNVFAIYTYASAGLALAAFQYVFFLANTFYGLYMWKRAKDLRDSEQFGNRVTPAQAEYLRNVNLPETRIVT